MKAAILSLSFLVTLLSHAHPPQAELTKHHFTAPHLGTVVHLVFYSPQPAQAQKLADRCFQRLKNLDAIFSDYCPESEVSKLCASPIGEAHQVSNELFTVIAAAQAISAKSKGAFDITLGQHTQRWRARSTAQEDQINYQHLHLDPTAQTITLQQPLKIDLGGIAKGYIADELMRLVKKDGLQHAAIIIGGETVLAAAPPGKKGWKIGIENPQKKLIGSLTLEHTALSTSGDSYQFFEINGQRHSHLIDPSTKQSKTNRLNVVVLAPTALQADGLATALRILTPDKALQLAKSEPTLQALFLPHQQNSYQTKAFPKLTPLKEAVKQ